MVWLVRERPNRFDCYRFRSNSEDLRNLCWHVASYPAGAYSIRHFVLLAFMLYVKRQAAVRDKTAATGAWLQPLARCLDTQELGLHAIIAVPQLRTAPACLADCQISGTHCFESWVSYRVVS